METSSQGNDNEGSVWRAALVRDLYAVYLGLVACAGSDFGILGDVASIAGAADVI